MIEKQMRTVDRLGYVLVLLMVVLQGFYAIYAYLDPAAFSALRGTDLVAVGDAEWVKIYASRTLFVSLIIGYLLYIRNYKILMVTALFGVVMPIADAVLAYQDHAPVKVVLKHIATIVYLLATFFVLRIMANTQTKN